MVICLERGADLHMAQLMLLPLTVSCFSKIQIGFTFLVPAYPGSPGKRAIKRVCVSLTSFVSGGERQCQSNGRCELCRAVMVNTTGCCGGWQGPRCDQRQSFNGILLFLFCT